MKYYKLKYKILLNEINLSLEDIKDLLKSFSFGGTFNYERGEQVQFCTGNLSTL